MNRIERKGQYRSVSIRDNTPYQETIGVSRVWTHPGRAEGAYYDIAIMELGTLYSNLIEFEKFLSDDLNGSSLSDFELLIENVFSRISIATQLSYPKIIDIVIDGISDKNEKTYW